ncbi:hypothetical protein [Candidatus Methylobacter oryzae]|uniref:Dihydroneopterin aldolase/epimerase domain-containing protein n=1 Tax=Candidatus Methylobacter oryzae TaxID=2497749 RepID=A0ABY3CAQ7_9GAMM|nr:hypothetical protein [Candidatus Methylobacter oryzae]TRW94636.1 hypothetical protein EKO24_011275 [Candidatus Methylobacter oryzae]
MDYEKCTTQTTNKLITASEKNRKLTIKNPSAKVVRKIKVDGCLITDSNKRCDYMFEIIDDPASDKISNVIYLELKGRHIQEAYEQLVATIDRFIAEHHGIKKACHIVASRVPRTGPEVQQLQVEMLRKKQAKLTVSTAQAFVTI